MAKLNLPNKVALAIAELADLEDLAVKQIASAIQYSKPVLDPEEFSADVVKRVQSVDSDLLKRIMLALSWLSATRVMNEVAIDEFFEDLPKDLPLKDKTADDAWKIRLKSLLRETTLVLSSKASALQLDHENVLFGIRIITDLRPIFEEGSECIKGSLIVHTLKVSHGHKGNREDIFFAMDDNDLLMLQDAIARAEKNFSRDEFAGNHGALNWAPVRAFLRAREADAVRIFRRELDWNPSGDER